MPTDPSQFTAFAYAPVSSVDLNGAYIAFNGPDGDALDICTLAAYKNLRQDGATGVVPIG